MFSASIQPIPSVFCARGHDRMSPVDIFLSYPAPFLGWSQVPPPPFFPDAFAHTRSTDTRQNVTGDQAYLQGRPGHGHVHPPAPQMTSPTGYPSQQYSSSQPPLTTSHRSKLSTTPTYDHASLSTHPPAPPPISGSTSYNPPFPQFPMPDVPLRHSSTNRSGPPPPLPISHRAMPMNVQSNASLSVPYDMRPPNTVHSPSQLTRGWSYLDMHDRDDVSSIFSDEDLGQNREGTHYSGEYMQEKSPPKRPAAGRQQVGDGGRDQQAQMPPPELFRCIVCERVSTRIEVEQRHGQCNGGHMGQWRRIHNEDHHVTR